MKRVLPLALFATVAALAGSLPGALAAAHSAGARAKITLERSAKFGKILANSKGFTIYAFTRDKPNHNKCQSINGCSGIWPAVVTSGKPIAGKGVKQSLLGTIKLKNGQHQVTYSGHPLYTYSADSSPHQTFYVNFSQFGGHWPALNAAGHEVK